MVSEYYWGTFSQREVDLVSAFIANVHKELISLGKTSIGRNDLNAIMKDVHFKMLTAGLTEQW